jgi:hypothetical protein
MVRLDPDRRDPETDMVKPAAVDDLYATSDKRDTVEGSLTPGRCRQPEAVDVDVVGHGGRAVKDALAATIAVSGTPFWLRPTSFEAGAGRSTRRRPTTATASPVLRER